MEIKIVTPKKEWLNPGEFYGVEYVVVEDQDDRVLVKLLHPNPNRFFQSTWTWSKNWIDELCTIETEVQG